MEDSTLTDDSIDRKGVGKRASTDTDAACLGKAEQISRLTPPPGNRKQVRSPSSRHVRAMFDFV
ncbi:sodium/myo-inositol cotransporter 2 isoform 3 [Anopheles sinensis]|uniref:Sodium/myo-inositol cotransporter 2 isoform 3 n=1 Tax=Anopheles sinensis TaxID=74873 RepID=A0A084WEF5_ANOSI|nr:sodium/myo-inositol cotransporter 2 isoform 3 [Anopheles sinensis]